MQYIKTKNLTQKKQVLCGLRGIFLLFSCQTPDMNQPNDIVATMPKPSWYVYKNIDNRRTTLEVTEEYKQYIGIEKWSDVIPNFRWKNLE